MAKTLKKLNFFSTLEEMQDNGLFRSLQWNAEERLRNMTYLNEQLFGPSKISDKKSLELYVSRPGESVQDFYGRVNREDP